jgi:opacity protein-like surface antigen
MRPLFKYFLFGAIIFFSANKTEAQSPLQMDIGYEINIPSGSFRDYITNPAYKGFTAGLAYPVSDQLKLGIRTGYNDYYQKYSRKVYEQGKGSAVSAVVSNSIQQIPIMISADYTILKKGAVRPYVAAGGGMNLISFDQYLGEFDNPQSKVKPALFGDAGIYIPLSRFSSTAIKVGGGYQYAPWSKGLDLSNWGIHAGLRFDLR